MTSLRLVTLAGMKSSYRGNEEFERVSVAEAGIYAAEGKRSFHDGTATEDYPVVEPHKEVASGNLGLGTENGTCVSRLRSRIPRKNLLIGEKLPSMRNLLEYSLGTYLTRYTCTSALTTVSDAFATMGFCRSNALGATGHLFECD